MAIGVFAGKSVIQKRFSQTYDGMNPPKRGERTPREKRRDANVRAWARELMSDAEFMRFCAAVGQGHFTKANDMIRQYNAWWWQRVRLNLWMASHS